MRNSQLPLLSVTAALAGLAIAAALGCQRSAELGPIASASASQTIREALTAGGEGGAGDAAASTGTGWATLTGRFIYGGEPPQMQPYLVNKDQATCTVGGKAPLQETLLVDSATKGIANVAIFVRTTPRVHESAASPPSEPIEFDQKVCVFTTHVLPLMVGQKMMILNSDNVGHNTKIDGRKNTLNQTVEAGKSIDFTPQAEEPIPATVQCSIHPWMIAYMFPRKNGYFAVTAPDGAFKIENLPAGDNLELQVWHESAPGQSHAVVVNTPETKELKWSKKGTFKLKLTENETKDLQITVPPEALGG